MAAEGTSSFKIADAYVLVGGKLDERSVQQAVDGAQKQVSRTPLNLQVGLDKRSLNSAVTETRTAVRDLSKDLNVKLGVEVDDRKLADAALGVMNAADAMGRDAKINLKVGLDNVSLVKADADLKAATKIMGRADGVNLKISTDGFDKAQTEIQQFDSSFSQTAKLVAGGIAIGAGGVEALGLAAVAGGFAAIAVASVASTKEVQQSFADLTTGAKQTAQQGFAPIIPAITDVTSYAKSQVVSLKTEFSTIAVALAPQLESVGHGLADSIHNAVTDIGPDLGRLPPLATSIGNSFGTLEHGVAGLVNNLNVGTAVQGWDSLSGAVGKVLPPFGLLLNTIAPVGTGLVNVLGGGLNVVIREFSSLEPVTKLVGAGITLLSPVISFLAPPLIAAGAASKLLTGSWTDLEGAGKRVKSFVSDLPGNFQSLGQKLGYTTDSAKAASVATAQLALDDALLAKEVDQLALAEAIQTAQSSKLPADALAVSAARKQLSSSTLAAKEATIALNEANDVSKFSMGPLTAVLGLVGLAAGLFAGQAHDAATETQDLSQQIIQLGRDAPQAAANMVGSSPDIQKLSADLKTAGTSVQSFSAAYSGSSSGAQQYTDALVSQQKALSDTHFNIVQSIQDNADQTSVNVQTSESVKEIADSIKSNKISLDSLTPSQQQAVAQYNALNNVVPQAQKALANYNAQQAATIDALQSQGIAISSTQIAWNSFGNALAGKVSSFNSVTSGIKQLTDNTLSADQTFFQAQQSFVQLDAAAVAAGQSYEQAGQSVSNASHAIAQAAQGVADAQHSEAQAALGVQTARQSYMQSVKQEQQSQLAYNNSLTAEVNAQRSLVLARQAAQVALQDLQRQTHDSADTEYEAQIRLFDAQTKVNNAGLAHTTLSLQDLATQGKLSSLNEGQYQLLLALSEAQNNLNDVTAANHQLNVQNAQQQAAGVDGAASVISAVQAVTSAQQQSSQAADSLSASQNGVTSAAQSVKDAQYAQQQAHLATQNAIYQENQATIALKQAVQNQTLAAVALNTAKQQDSRTTELNTSKGVENYMMLENLFEKNFTATGSIQDATAATEAEGKKMGFTAGQVDAVVNSVTGLDGKSAVFGIVGQPSVDISQIVAAAVQQGINPEGLGFTPSQVQTALGGQPGQRGRKAAATGGLLKGPGTKTSDSILGMTETGPVALSDQEFVVNAADTQRTLPLLEHINAGGKVPGFASGGQLAKSLMSANLRLAAWDAGVGALANTYNILGYKGIPNLPKPPAVTPTAALGTGTVPKATGNAAQAQAYAASVIGSFGWGADQMAPLIRLWNQESGWNAYAVNPSSGAYGIPQSLGHGHPYDLGDYANQIQWGLNYIRGRYGSPSAAWAHEVGNNWYDQGGLLPQGLSLAMNNTGANENKAVFTNQQWGDLHVLANSARNNAGGDVHYHSHTTVIAQGDDSAHAVAMKTNADAEWKLMTMVRR